MVISSGQVLDPITRKFTPGTLVLDEDGTILEISFGKMEGQEFPGILSPGFINPHCHLELSHLKGKVREHAGMAGFISGLIPQRKAFSEAEIEQAMKLADQEMIANGIVAVGDISNTNASCKVKSESTLYYHTFVELLDLTPGKTEEVFLKGLETLHSFGDQPASLVPHAPYTVTPGLLKRIYDWHERRSLPACIHFQESDAENDFFRHQGPIYDLFCQMNIDLSWVPKLNSSIEYIKASFNIARLQLVHNTFFPADSSQLPTADLFFCTCPAANLYIENKLPDYKAWIKSGLKITVGTDSYASNHRLSILEELKIIQNSCPELPLAALLEWATRNGADFLGIGGIFGTLEVGKRPGILHITGTGTEQLSGTAAVKRLI